MALTVDDLRLHITSSLGDEALELLLDAAYEDIDKRIGPSGAVTEVLPAGAGKLLMLSCPASALTAVVEYAYTTSETTLATDDYELIGDQQLIRTPDGTNPSNGWNGRVKITYTTLVTDASRDRAAVSLVKLDLDQHPGVSSERLGDWSVTYASDPQYATSREAILATLGSGFIAK